MGVFAGDRRHRVAVLVRDGILPMELGLVHQVLGQARSPAGDLLYDVRSCGLRPGDVRTSADFTVSVSHGLGALAEADTVVVPASHEADEGDGPLDPPLAAALAAIRPDARIASICTGAFVLAAAGLLDGRRATTHWMAAARLQRRHPEVEVDGAVLYVDDGRVLTSAGEAAGIDLCLHLVRRDHGAAVANEVARRTVVAPHRSGGQAQFVCRPVPGTGRTATTDAARAWALDHLDEPISLRDLAARAAVSVRTFTRRFRDEVGCSPTVWLTEQRVELARRLLEETDEPVERVAVETGFGSAATLRSHFTRTCGVSPSAYRATFRGT